MVAFGLGSVLVLGIGWLWWRRQPPPAQAPRNGTTRVEDAGPTKVFDPLARDRPAQFDTTRVLESDWIKAPPPAQFQYSLPASKRGGVHPCDSPAPKLTEGAIALPLAKGRIIVPFPERLTGKSEFDLVFHIHGEDPVLRELEASETAFVLVTLTLPPNKSYAPLFAGSGLFGKMLDAAEGIVGQRVEPRAKLRHVLLSAWSSGVEGVRSILYQPDAERADAFVLIDGIHAPRNKRFEAHLEPFANEARRAAEGRGWMVITHSSIPTVPFASTTESTHAVLAQLDAEPRMVSRDDGFGLELIDFYGKKGLQVRGYAGNDKADHCAQLFLLRSYLRAFERLWTAGGR